MIVHLSRCKAVGKERTWMQLVAPPLWDSTAPIPTSETSTSTMKGLSGLGSMRIGAEVKWLLSLMKANSASGP